MSRHQDEEKKNESKHLDLRFWNELYTMKFVEDNRLQITTHDSRWQRVYLPVPVGTITSKVGTKCVNGLTSADVIRTILRGDSLIAFGRIPLGS